MTKLEMPTKGGSHIRNKDGSLSRVAHTTAPSHPDMPAASPKDTAPAKASAVKEN